MLENLDMARAIHRLDREHAMFRVFVTGVHEGVGGFHREHILLIPAPVTGRLPQRFVEQLRCIDLVIAELVEPAAHIRDQGLKQCPALGVPEHRARPFFLKMEQVHLASETAMIALFRLFQLVEIGVECVFCGEGRRINPRQHRIIAVAAPIGTGHLHQLERVADFTRRGHMRAAAEIEPVALPVDFQILARRDRIDQLDLERFALGLEQAANILALPDFLGERLVARDDFPHFCFNRGEIIRRERLGAVKIIIEAVFDHRADGHLCSGPERLNRFGEHMGAIMPDQFERARIVAAEKLDAGILRNRVGQIAHNAIERHRDCAFGERRGNALGNIKSGNNRLEAAIGAIREGDRNHVSHLLLTPANRAGKRKPGVSSSGRPLARIDGFTPDRRVRVARPPASIAPRCIPAGDRRQYFGHKIQPRCAKRVTPAQAGDTDPPAGP